jgi:hypothetical protein
MGTSPTAALGSSSFRASAHASPLRCRTRGGFQLLRRNVDVRDLRLLRGGPVRPGERGELLCIPLRQRQFGVLHSRQEPRPGRGDELLLRVGRHDGAVQLHRLRKREPGERDELLYGRREWGGELHLTGRPCPPLANRK